MIDKECVLTILAILVSVFLFILVVCFPFAYLDGRATSKWLKQTRAIEVPWYDAMWLNVEIHDVDGKLKTEIKEQQQ